MMAKIVKGASFNGVVKYILDPEKQTNLLAADGVRLKNLDSIAQSFEAQRELNLRVRQMKTHSTDNIKRRCFICHHNSQPHRELRWQQVEG